MVAVPVSPAMTASFGYTFCALIAASMLAENSAISVSWFTGFDVGIGGGEGGCTGTAFGVGIGVGTGGTSDSGCGCGGCGVGTLCGGGGGGGGGFGGMVTDAVVIGGGGGEGCSCCQIRIPARPTAMATSRIAAAPSDRRLRSVNIPSEKTYFCATVGPS